MPVELPIHGVTTDSLTASEIRLIARELRPRFGGLAVSRAISTRDLFEISPEIRVLFPDDISAQVRKLTEMLSTLVGKLDRPHELATMLEELGERHRDYGVFAASLRAGRTRAVRHARERARTAFRRADAPRVDRALCARVDVDAARAPGDLSRMSRSPHQAIPQNEGHPMNKIIRSFRVRLCHGHWLAAARCECVARCRSPGASHGRRRSRTQMVQSIPNPIMFVTQFPVTDGFRLDRIGLRQSSRRHPVRGARWRSLHRLSRRRAAKSHSRGAVRHSRRTAAGAARTRSPCAIPRFTGPERKPCSRWSRVRRPSCIGDSVYYWQLYEVSGLGEGDTASISKVANQPTDYNNVQPAYDSDGNIIFVSDRVRHTATMGPADLASDRGPLSLSAAGRIRKRTDVDGFVEAQSCRPASSG